ncbi:hypothetical protein RJZ56_005759 [Blastomyces dermatitidis]|uniref:Short-chain dehydrogenase/reductase n=2 Tax=Ajellomyces dermatitidis TaxID=5039 RepID=F2T7E9_AJEDA|nr:short-chain dehydrogenase/reductase [Blastomyces dermatitidis ER-3]XP_045279646.1 short-chain dehydrogenase/reductase, variant 1 [Blastomyces dermatitidis ER-3]XP_045279647.1 short-chain dehydrogenase/reductase, variant 2 [Blastomyces dermatitidis ER-3]EGE79162.1 short-chain dehydrogenase/reductase [Blastomyces dermatitidis ATCC 18188]EEQ86444.1 short-chain dehydrogenase/reductase [Blastomyces dermatitidis ER-3]KMW66920.1 short-chain dehydrogenase/reductase, variant [Blastomyces dermatitidi
MGFMAAFLYSQLFVTPKYPTASFANQTIVITGSNTGLGLEAARHFARLNAKKIIIAVRNVAAGEKAKELIETSSGRANICEVWELDLASYASIKAFAQRASTELPRIDVLLENAGIATHNYDTAEGHERTITINVIGTFLLGLLLLPKLKESATQTSPMKPRWCIVTSEVHAQAEFPEWKSPNTFEKLDDTKTLNMKERYEVSKLLEILVVREIAPKLADSGVILNLINPGFCQSGLMREFHWLVLVIKTMLTHIMVRTTEVGSRTLVAAAAEGDESHGTYMVDGKVSNRHLSAFVKSEDGKIAGKKVWEELKAILENIVPGVSGKL